MTYSVAVIGSGPSGFFTSASLLALNDRDVRVDMYERLPTPWGLVRAGVAPDHPKIKSVSAQYTKTASHDRFRFFGNVEIGLHVTREELIERYDGVVYAVGAQAERKLGVPGEDLPGSAAAIDFVGWYNGNPNFCNRTFDLDVRRAVVIGNGNVALDVARILCTPPDRLSETDIADHALEALHKSAIEEVVVVGRRGPAQAAFTSPELQELRHMTGAFVDVDVAAVAYTHGDDDLNSGSRRNLDVLRDYAGQEHSGESRRISLRFLLSPVEVRGTGQAESVVFARNELRASEDGQVKAVDTGVRETVEAGLVLSAVGYRGVELPGVPFDEPNGVIPHDGGRVEGGDREYVAGWIKRGPRGVIGTNKKCAAETVKTLVTDLGDQPSGAADPAAVERWIRQRQPDLVDLTGWAAIDAVERSAGEASGRPRVKLCATDELVAAARENGVAE